jgi:membrane protein YqaA with SNARE-associated domain
VFPPLPPEVLVVPGGLPLEVLVALGDVYAAFEEGLLRAIETATGPAGLAIIFVYSFLIAFVLPLPSEVVLAPAPHLETGLSTGGNLAVIVVVSAVGKAIGSVVALWLGNEAKSYGPLLRALKRSRFDVVEWSERRTVDIAQRWGYVGLALALCVPGFPDTLSIYAFAVLEDDYPRFAAATLAGSAGRLVVTLAAAGGVLAIL